MVPASSRSSAEGGGLTRRTFRQRAALAAAFFFPGVLAALAPHEVLLLVNEQSPRSIEIARHYADLRRIPSSHVVHVSVSEKVLDPGALLSRDAFLEQVWRPARRAMEERGLSGSILAWIYSLDFPVAVAAPGLPHLSLQGATLLGEDDWPDRETVDQGRWISPFFRGPVRPGEEPAPSGTFERFAEAQDGAYRMPSMLLGFAGSRGMTVPEIHDHLRRAASGDGSIPGGGIVLVTNRDVRTACRAWQFPGAVETLRARGLRADIRSSLPASAAGIIGLLAGDARVDMPQDGLFSAGAMGDHLTSLAGVFHSREQTKLTAWLRAGAAASSGTVSEPYSIWTKFPNAYFHAHHAAGCTMLESFFQSTASPLQLLMVGDPLSAPWVPRVALTLVALHEDPQPDEALFHLAVPSGAVTPPVRLGFLLNGRPLEVQPELPLRLDTRLLSDGYHTLRAVLSWGGPVTRKAFAETGFTVNHRGRSVVLEGTEDHAVADGFRPLSLGIAASPGAWRLAIASGERILREAEGGESAIQLDPRVLGFGPIRLQAVAWFDGEEPVRSRPLTLRVRRLNRPPVLEALSKEPLQDGWRWAVTAVDPEGDPLQTDWFLDQTAFLEKPPAEDGPLLLGGGRIVREGTAHRFSSSGEEHGSLLLLKEERSSPHDWQATLVFPAGADGALCRQGGLVFGWKEEGAAFAFFGINGDLSGWSLGRWRDGRLRDGRTIGAPLRPDRAYRLALTVSADGRVQGRVDGEDVVDIRLPAEALSGRVGFIVSRGAVVIRQAFLPYPGGGQPSLAVRDDTLGERLHVRVSDGHAESWRAVEDGRGKTEDGSPDSR